jgi:photosystem II stability/assembly factor-like uncharacterized protein
MVRTGRCLLLAAVFTLSTGCPSDPDAEAKWRLDLEADEDIGALMSVWGPSADEVYSVGGQPGDTGFGVLMRWDGDAWTRGELPDAVPMLNWVHGAGGELFLVGESGTVLHSTDQAESFEAIGPADVSDPLWGVWAAAPNDLWAVGGDPFEMSSQLLHYDGSEWTRFELPPLDRPAGTLFKVWGSSSDSVWVVGDAGIILHWDGSAWTQQLAGTASDLISLWGTGPDDVAAIGGRAGGTLARWDGSSWASESLTGLPGMNGVWMDDTGDAIIGGTLGNLASVSAGSFDFELDEFSVSPMVVHAVFGLEDGTRFAVGGTLDRSPPYLGVIARFGTN